ncbi:unnamed protein product [Peniophora sp. CBMAI 1063]|nr:unnamed protein product [Peniophora sp. CBMAI 1063]
MSDIHMHTATNVSSQPSSGTPPPPSSSGDSAQAGAGGANTGHHDHPGVYAGAILAQVEILAENVHEVAAEVAHVVNALGTANERGTAHAKSLDELAKKMDGLAIDIRQELRALDMNIRNGIKAVTDRLDKLEAQAEAQTEELVRTFQLALQNAFAAGAQHVAKK